MSYILDALKKSEAERDANAPAAFVIAEAERTHAERRKHRLVLWVIGIALVANATLLATWLTWRANPQTVAAEPLLEKTEPAKDPIASTRRTAPVTDRSTDSSPAIETAEPRPAVAQPTQTSQQPSPPPTLRRVGLSGLPSSLRAAFPGLTFSTHVFATDPALRAVVVNGTRRTEGEIVEGMKVEEITEDGVVLHFGDYLVEISVLEGWEDD